MPAVRPPERDTAGYLRVGRTSGGFFFSYIWLSFLFPPLFSYLFASFVCYSRALLCSVLLLLMPKKKQKKQNVDVYLLFFL